MTRATLDKLHMQAEMQVASRVAGTIAWQYRAADPDRARRGLAMLPAPSRNDIFFDIEGFPWAADGLEYLLGVVTVDTGAPVFRDWWAHDEIQEKRAFEQFIDWTFARWKVDPTLHVYHYAAYERTAGSYREGVTKLDFATGVDVVSFAGLGLTFVMGAAFDAGTDLIL